MEPLGYVINKNNEVSKTDVLRVKDDADYVAFTESIFKVIDSMKTALGRAVDTIGAFNTNNMNRIIVEIQYVIFAILAYLLYDIFNYST
jgi:hypothetical protein